MNIDDQRPTDLRPAYSHTLDNFKWP